MDFPRSSISQRETERQVELVGWHLRIWKHTVLIRPALRFGRRSCLAVGDVPIFNWFSELPGLLVYPKNSNRTVCLLCRETTNYQPGLFCTFNGKTLQLDPEQCTASVCLKLREKWLHNTGRFAMVWFCPKIVVYMFMHLCGDPPSHPSLGVSTPAKGGQELKSCTEEPVTDSTGEFRATEVRPDYTWS